jgi:hypothetical protein
MDLQTLVPAIGTIAAALIWFIRLEAKLIYLEKDHNKLEDTSTKTDLLFQSKVDKLMADINQIQISLTRIETRLRSKEERE